jgi:DNA-binding NarL/FixJ family response regulator
MTCSSTLMVRTRTLRADALRSLGARVQDQDILDLSDTSVFVADGHTTFRTAVAVTLEAHGFRVAGSAHTADDAVDGCILTAPRLCLVDVDLPGGGVVAAGEIAHKVPTTAVVMLATIERDADLFGSLAAGAAGYLPKDIAPECMAAALRGVLAGEAALSRALVARLITEFRERIRRRRSGLGAPLTTREWQVLELMGQGSSTIEIAAVLDVTPVTVRSHISSLMRKLAVSTREQVVALYERQPSHRT